MRNLTAFISTIFISFSLISCGGGGGGGKGISLNPGSDVLSFEKDGSTLTSITIEENDVVSARLVIQGDPVGADSYVFEVESNNPALIPVENVSITGTGKFRDVVITPVTDQTGTVTLTGRASSNELEVFIEATLIINVVSFGDITCVLDTSTLPCELN